MRSTPHDVRVRAYGILVFSLMACGLATVESRPYHLSPTEFAIVQRALNSYELSRLAADADNAAPTAIAEMRAQDASFSPFFAREVATNSSGGFAFVLVQLDTFRVFYVRNPTRDTLATEVAGMTWLNRGFIRFSGDTLLVALFNSGEIFEFRWNAATSRMELIPEVAEQ